MTMCQSTRATPTFQCLTGPACFVWDGRLMPMHTHVRVWDGTLRRAGAEREGRAEEVRGGEEEWNNRTAHRCVKTEGTRLVS